MICFLQRYLLSSATSVVLASALICQLFGDSAKLANSQAETKETTPSAAAPKLSEATALTNKKRDSRSQPTPPPMDAAKAAQEKRARELARLRGEITFDDLKFDIEKDGLFEESMLRDEIRKLHEKKIKIRGFMLPSSVFQTKGIKQFVLVRDNKECCFGPGAAIYDCVMVEMAADKTTDFSERVMTVSGIMTIDTETYQYPDGGHYAIYKIVANETK